MQCNYSLSAEQIIHTTEVANKFTKTMLKNIILGFQISKFYRPIYMQCNYSLTNHPLIHIEIIIIFTNPLIIKILKNMILCPTV